MVSCYVVWFVFLKPPIMSDGFPEDVAVWLAGGKGRFNIRRSDPDIEWVCVFGGYQTLGDALNDAGISSSNSLYIGEGEFVFALEYKNANIEYRLFENGQHKIVSTFGKCIAASLDTDLILVPDSQSGVSTLKFVSARES